MIKREMQYRGDKLSETIISCIIQVHQTLGPGFKETIYRNALLIEMKKRHLALELEKEIVVYYDGVEVGRHRLDLLVEQKIILELKTVENFCKANYAQIRSYLKAADLTIGILVNFSKEKADFRRIERG